MYVKMIFYDGHQILLEMVLYFLSTTDNITICWVQLLLHQNVDLSMPATTTRHIESMRGG